MKKVSCEYCGDTKAIEKTRDWEMQYLHFAEDVELKFLTCEICKTLSPMKYIEKLNASKDSHEQE